MSYFRSVCHALLAVTLQLHHKAVSEELTKNNFNTLRDWNVAEMEIGLIKNYDRVRLNTLRTYFTNCRYQLHESAHR